MDFAPGLLLGLQVALQPANLLYCFIGVLLGTLVGVLPGIGPAAAIALLLPVTAGMSPTAGVVLLAGIYYGTMYGGSSTSILVNIPGEASSVVTCLDGHQMALQGRAGPALGIAAIGSFIAGTLGVIALTLISAPLAKVAVSFGAAEYFSLMVLGLVLIGCLSSGSLPQAIMTASLGIVLGLVGSDLVSGGTRFTYDIPALIEGIDVVTLVIGLFGVSEVLMNLESRLTRTVVDTKIRNLLPTRDDWRRSAKPIARGSVLGFFLGLLPGGGGVIASFLSYAVEKRFSKTPERFGKGAIEGVAAPEAANNAAASASFIPLLTLGIPPNVILGILLGAFMIHGVQPGPLLMVNHPELFWGVVASMYVGNVMLLVLNLPLVGIWVQLLRVPYGVLFPLILVFCVVGVYGTTGSLFQLFQMGFFGVVGYLLRRNGYDLTPLVVGFVLGPLLELHMRRGLMTSGGDWSFFVTRPMSAVCLALAVILAVWTLVPKLRARVPVLNANTETT
ncbi:tripartite tricarboxylate transporter permease [Ramlibacter sp.]|uniref:tripartite tricarboxylate transporter permease n=1 Tax=Ramlibacter sp. TaxID=1917967 RepID=UPI003D1338B1